MRPVRLTTAAFVALVLVYFVSFGSTAWHPSDYEYVLACSARILRGELPYRDFLYHKPPLTPFLHAVWLLLPGGLGIRASRLCFYVQLAASGLLPILWAVHRRKVAFGWRLPLLGVTFTVIALHNFPAMAWQTSDGIFFAVLALVCFLESLTSGRALPRALASTALCLSILCKQSYLLVAAALGIFAVLELVRRKRIAMFVATAGPAVVVFGATALALWLTGSLEGFVEQFRSQSSAAALKYHAWELVWSSSARWTCLPWAALALLPRLDSEQRDRRFWVGRGLAAAALACVAVPVVSWPEEGFGALGQAVFFLLVGTLLGRLLFRRTEPALLVAHAGVFLIAWSTQLSLGYATPILGVAALGLVFHDLLPTERSLLLDVAPAAALTLVVGAVFWNTNYQSPYRDHPRGALTRDLGEISARLSGIRTNPSTFGRYAELADLVRTHAAHRPFAVLQDYPGAHLLFDQPNPLAIDWNYPPEPDGFEDRLWQQLVSKHVVAIVPKEVRATWGEIPLTHPQRPSCDAMDFSSHAPLTQRVTDNWMLLAAGNFFCVYVEGPD